MVKDTKKNTYTKPTQRQRRVVFFIYLIWCPWIVYEWQTKGAQILARGHFCIDIYTKI